MIRSSAKRLIKRLFYWQNASFVDISDSDQRIYQLVKPYTMTSPERVFAVLDAVRYLLKYGIPGDIVECGVWRGGTMMAIAHLLKQYNSLSRKLYLFDTFEGMPQPADVDADFRGRKARLDFHAKRRSDASSNWCYAALSEVQANLAAVGYPEGRIHYVVGKVEETVPAQIPETISLLRLDTDWYESTKHELIHLYPRLVRGGVLIIDDYGHWEGARKAVDEYFAENKTPILLNRIDYTGRIAVKVE